MPQGSFEELVFNLRHNHFLTQRLICGSHQESFLCSFRLLKRTGFLAHNMRSQSLLNMDSYYFLLQFNIKLKKELLQQEVESYV